VTSWHGVFAWGKPKSFSYTIKIHNRDLEPKSLLRVANQAAMFTLSTLTALNAHLECLLLNKNYFPTNLMSMIMGVKYK
jgi:hypothetical protein